MAKSTKLSTGTSFPTVTASTSPDSAPGPAYTTHASTHRTIHRSLLPSALRCTLSAVVSSARYAALRSTLPSALRSAAGGFLAILLCASLSSAGNVALLMAPFGATCVLAFALPDSPLAQPRNIIGGHALSTAIGLLTLTVFGSHVWSLALAVGLAMAAMQLTRTVHPPAGADPLLVMLSGVSWSFLLTPVISGSVMIVAFAWLYHRIAFRSSASHRYPKRWC